LQGSYPVLDDAALTKHLAVSEFKHGAPGHMLMIPETNQLLHALLPSDRECLEPHLQRVPLRLGRLIWEPGERLDLAYFPVDSVVSLLYTMHNGTTAEMGMVGQDGMLGLSIFLGGESSWCRAVVAAAGDAFAAPAPVIRELRNKHASFRTVLLRYTQALLTQVSQTAVCNRLHSFEQRLCRWLLLCRDRVGRPELLMTQELIAQMLGGRRESVTVAAGRLQGMGLIHYCRGHITILNRPGLEAACCECYRVVEDQLDLLFTGKRAPQISRSAAAVEAVGRTVA